MRDINVSISPEGWATLPNGQEINLKLVMFAMWEEWSKEGRNDSPLLEALERMTILTGHYIGPQEEWLSVEENPR